MRSAVSRWAAAVGLVRRSAEPQREVSRSEDAWREQLTPEQFHVLRRRGTERPFTGEAVRAGADGLYRCAECGAALFRAGAKFDSGTGWPSFTDTEPAGVELRRDLKLGIPRTEVLCRRCGGHLGHVFNDGPSPGRKRYCINGCALAPGDGRGL